MPIMPLNTAELMAFLLILIRVSVIMALVPIFGSLLIPVQVKVAMITVLSYFLWTTIKMDVSVFPGNFIGFVPLVVIEAMIGLSIGLLIRTIFAGVQLAGQFIGYQMGMALANVIDPQTGTQTSILAEFSYILALFVFLAVNGHYLVIKGLVDSFELVTPGRFNQSQALYELITHAASRMFVIAVKIGAAPFAVLFFTKVSMGIVAKAVPQMNVLFVGLPLYIMIGLFIFGLSLAFFPTILIEAFVELETSIITLLRLI
ncbi:MAG: flagellar biosynthetic protein FliR [Deltaproteobacteria bacterium]|nr:flagellar biosynthetic protein FliR [Deltaproteobacteria bacterium]